MHRTWERITDGAEVRISLRPRGWDDYGRRRYSVALTVKPETGGRYMVARGVDFIAGAGRDNDGAARDAAALLWYAVTHNDDDDPLPTLNSHRSGVRRFLLEAGVHAGIRADGRVEWGPEVFGEVVPESCEE